jgi:hypothetical protein
MLLINKDKNFEEKLKRWICADNLSACASRSVFNYRLAVKQFSHLNFRTNAKKYKLNTDKIATFGGSAGRAIWLQRLVPPAM